MALNASNFGSSIERTHHQVNGSSFVTSPQLVKSEIDSRLIEQVKKDREYIDMIAQQQLKNEDYMKSIKEAINPA